MSAAIVAGAALACVTVVMAVGVMVMGRLAAGMSTRRAERRYLEARAAYERNRLRAVQRDAPGTLGSGSRVMGLYKGGRK